MDQRLTELIEQIDKTPHGPIERDLVTQAIDLAEALGDVEAQYRLRLRWMTSCKMSRDVEGCMNAFAWCLGKHLSDPARFPYQPEENVIDLLWGFKWVIRFMLLNPEFSRERIEQTITQMERVFAQNGAGRTGPVLTRASAYAFMGLRAEMAPFLAEYHALGTDDFDDCPACRLGNQIEVALLTDEIDEARTLFWRLLHEKQSCNIEPEATAGLMLPYLALTEDADEVKSVHRMSLHYARLALDRNVLTVAQNIEFCARTGNLARAADILAVYLPDLDELPHDEYSQLALYRAGWFTCQGLVAANLGQVPIAVTGQVAQEKLQAQGATPAAQLLEAFAANLSRLVAAFDHRNGTDHFSHSLELAQKTPLPTIDLGEVTVPQFVPEPGSPDEWVTRMQAAYLMKEIDVARAAASQLLTQSVEPAVELLARQILLPQLGEALDEYEPMLALYQRLGTPAQAEAYAGLGPLEMGATADLTASRILAQTVAERLAAHPEAAILAAERELFLAISTSLAAPEENPKAGDEIVQIASRIIKLGQRITDPWQRNKAMTLGIVTLTWIGASTDIPVHCIQLRELGEVNPGAEYQCALALARWGADTGQVAAARTEIERAAKIAGTAGCRQAQLVALAQGASYAEAGKDFQTAASFAARWLGLAVGLDRAETESLRLQLGRCQTQGGQPRDAVDTLELLLSTSTDPKALSQASYWLGEAELALSHPKTAVESWLKGVAPATQIGDHSNAAHLLTCAANVLITHRQFDQAQVAITDGLSLAEESAPNRVARLLEQRARLLLANKDESAFAVFDQAAAAAVNPYDGPDILDTKARELGRLGRLAEGIAAALTSADGFADLQLWDESARSVALAAEFLGREKRFSEAFTLIQQAAETPVSAAARKFLDGWIAELTRIQASD